MAPHENSPDEYRQHQPKAQSQKGRWTIDDYDWTVDHGQEVDDSHYGTGHQKDLLARQSLQEAQKLERWSLWTTPATTGGSDALSERVSSQHRPSRGFRRLTKVIAVLAPVAFVSENFQHSRACSRVEVKLKGHREVLNLLRVLDVYEARRSLSYQNQNLFVESSLVKE